MTPHDRETVIREDHAQLGDGRPYRLASTYGSEFAMLQGVEIDDANASRAAGSASSRSRRVTAHSISRTV